MLSDKTLLKRDYEKLQFLRWVLFLITAAEAAGLNSLSRARLHSLLFMSFASARFYGLQPLRQRAQRTTHGPYYRAAHLALGHLVFADLVVVTDFEAHPSPKDLQFEGMFKLTRNGLQVCNVLRQTDMGMKIYSFLLDICLGAVQSLEAEDIPEDREDVSLDRMLVQDLTYVSALNRPGDMLIIEEEGDESTPTVKGLNLIQSTLGEKLLINKKDVLGAYQSILRSRAEVA
ncbi:hypothetical protein AO072_03305 [Pseudomonas syringae ICMP 13102]|uniref:Uncharacterized protein n=1 Tax=Pseudomonas cerasi TaxID=1583341 RepID=A0A193SKB0_9PSED|nr:MULTISPECIES: hypothetical protein [Pseudomonas]KTB89604.1 hypothetical protein AO072_03305 [Pseudomonas syringae ICMP 13102]MCK9747077.1 hypothetical protein [Pseudomonas syringae pv. syringae]POR59499.1 hypothetical protein BKM23_13680 [Pseudomonas syringae pv. syringae]CZT26662.1 hypothetical protein PCPL58_0206 [Pseudomonas cerasi]SOS14342.1 hypothetical protein PL963_00208 [Pseudomonas cerasi]